MFKKKINKISNENGSSDYKSSLTVPFTVSFEDENPEKMKMIKKEIDRQKKKTLIIHKIYSIFFRKTKRKI